MSYDETLAERVRRLVGDRRGVTERKMFGGLAFILNGNMCCGIVREDLVLRVGPAAYEDVLKRPHVRPMDFTGRPLKGLVYIGREGCRTPEALRSWIDQAVGFTSTLPRRASKKPAGRKPGRRR